MFRCFYCGELKDNSEQSLEHIIPESCGGNITTKFVCITCNQAANKQIDEAFKNEWLVSWDRALLGLKGKRGQIHTETLNVKSQSGEEILLEISEQGFVPITKPSVDIDWDGGVGKIKVDPRYVEKVMKDIEKKAEKRGVKLTLPEKMPEKQTADPGFLSINTTVNLNPLRREQVKILLGLSCLYIPNFVNSNTAKYLRDYLWKTKAEDVILGLESVVYPYPVFNDTLPSFTVEGNMIYSYPTSGMEIENIFKVLNENSRKHLFAYYNYQGKTRLVLSLFGHINSYIDTFEASNVFFPGPINFDGKAIILNPRTGEREDVSLKSILGMVGFLASAKLAGFFSSRPDLFDALKSR